MQWPCPFTLSQWPCPLTPSQWPCPLTSSCRGVLVCLGCRGELTINARKRLVLPGQIHWNGYLLLQQHRLQLPPTLTMVHATFVNSRAGSGSPPRHYPTSRTLVSTSFQSFGRRTTTAPAPRSTTPLNRSALRSGHRNTTHLRPRLVASSPFASILITALRDPVGR